MGSITRTIQDVLKSFEGVVTGIRSFMLTSSSLGGNVFQAFDLIAQGKLNEHDLIQEVKMEECPQSLKDILVEAKSTYHITSIRIFRKSLAYKSFTSLYMTPLILDKYFIRCKLESRHIDEIVLSEHRLCFIAYGYKGDIFHMYYDPKKGGFRVSDDGYAPGSSVELSRSFGKEVVEELRKSVTDELIILSHSNFNEVFDYIKKYSFAEEQDAVKDGKKSKQWGNWDELDRDFFNNNKIVIIMTDFSARKAKIKPEYFKAAELIFEKLLVKESDSA